jgi:hypothetical protein
VLPDVRVVVSVLVTAVPAVTEPFPELLIEKLKSGGTVTVKAALAVALGLEPVLKAMAFTVALFVKVIAPVYRVED